MASSEVEIASSSSFGHVLRDRNRRDRCAPRDSNAFQKNLKDLVHTHIHSCISSSQPNNANSSDSNENSSRHHRRVDYADLWVHKPQWDNNENSPNTAVDKWDRAREMVISSRQTKQRGETLPETTTTTTTVVEVPNSGGVSTLVRRWRDFETVSKSVNNSNPSSAKSNCENTAFADSNVSTCDESSVDGRFETPAMSVNGESSGDWEQAYKTAVSDTNKEREKLRVADIIRKLASSNGEENHENEHNCTTTAALSTGECLPRIKTSFDHSEQQLLQRNFFPVLHSPRIIRGRQALSDLLLQMERDRLRELESLKERKAVSKFQQRGRIQALLKVRFLRRGTDNRDGRSTNGTSSESNRVSNSAIMHIRERFNTGSQNGVANSRSLSREAAENTQESRNQQKVQNCDKDNKGRITYHRELVDNNAVKVESELASYKRREGNQKREIIKESTKMQPGVADSRSSSSPISEIASTSARENHPEEPSEPMTLSIKVIDNSSQIGKVFTSNQLQVENHHGEVNEKISPRRMTPDVKVTSSSNPQKEMPIQVQHSDSSHSPNHNEVDRSPQAVSPSSLHCTSQLQSSDISHDQASWENASCQANDDKSLEFLDTSRSPKDSEQSDHREKQDSNNLQHAGTSNEWSSESPKHQSDWEEEATNQNLVESTDCGWVSDYSHAPSGWDELQSNQDWISDISRPREEWEGLRQERYQEMLDPFLENHDIRQLLNRRSVSIFLNSGLRDKIDRLMESRSQELPNAMSRQLEERVGPRMAKEESKEEEVISHRETRAAGGEDDEEEADSGYEDDCEDDNTPSRQQYLKPEELVGQKKASESWSENQDTLPSWRNDQDRVVTDDSSNLPSNSSPQPQLPNIYSHHNQQYSPSTRHPSIEMELIYELRGHMEQLHQEIFEIRRSINSCMNMQMNLQHSIKDEVAAAIIQSGPMIGSNSDKKGANIANCCICYEQQVDSLLYRCGHMCTCFRCAHELLWGTGKCPICETPIIDVVRAYIHS